MSGDEQSSNTPLKSKSLTLTFIKMFLIPGKRCGTASLIVPRADGNMDCTVKAVPYPGKFINIHYL